MHDAISLYCDAWLSKSVTADASFIMMHEAISLCYDACLYESKNDAFYYNSRWFEGGTDDVIVYCHLGSFNYDAFLIQSVLYHIRLSPSFNAKINP